MKIARARSQLDVSSFLVAANIKSACTFTAALWRANHYSPLLCSDNYLHFSRNCCQKADISWDRLKFRKSFQFSLFLQRFNLYLFSLFKKWSWEIERFFSEIIFLHSTPRFRFAAHFEARRSTRRRKLHFPLAGFAKGFSEDLFELRL